MNIKKFEYFLNAVHYCIYLEEVWSNKKIERIILLFFKTFFSKKFMQRIYTNQKNKELQNFNYGSKWGLSIGVTHYLFGYLYSGYPFFFSFILIGIALRCHIEVNKVMIFCTFAVPIGICYIPAYKAVFSNDKYLEYFKLFKKENKQWHKKWKRIALVFSIGSIIISALGILFAFIIAIVI